MLLERITLDWVILSYGNVRGDGGESTTYKQGPAGKTPNFKWNFFFFINQMVRMGNMGVKLGWVGLWLDEKGVVHRRVLF